MMFQPLSVPPSQVLNSYSSAQTLTSNNYNVFGDTSGGSFSITIPLAAGRFGQVYNIKNIGTSGTLTLARTGSDTFNTSTSVRLMPGDSITLISNGSSVWQCMNINFYEVIATTAAAVAFPSSGGTGEVYAGLSGNGLNLIAGSFYEVSAWGSIRRATSSNAMLAGIGRWGENQNATGNLGTNITLIGGIIAANSDRAFRMTYAGVSDELTCPFATVIVSVSANRTMYYNLTLVGNTADVSNYNGSAAGVARRLSRVA